jgi:hypothetical protein
MNYTLICLLGAFFTNSNVRTTRREDTYGGGGGGGGTPKRNHFSGWFCCKPNLGQCVLIGYTYGGGEELPKCVLIGSMLFFDTLFNNTLDQNILVFSIKGRRRHRHTQWLHFFLFLTNGLHISPKTPKNQKTVTSMHFSKSMRPPLS